MTLLSTRKPRRDEKQRKQQQRGLLVFQFDVCTFVSII